MSYPDFLCIGAQKAGTTWLHFNMLDHPHIWLPKRKEIHYFDKKFKVKIDDLSFMSHNINENEDSYIEEYQSTKGRPGVLQRLKKYSPAHILWELKYRYMPKTDAWYASLFSKSGMCITGDFTPAYSMLNSESVAYIHKIMPESRIIFIMRNPIERAWSHARMDLSAHAGKSVTEVDDASFIKQFHSAGALMRTNYLRTLNIWESSYGQGQVLPLFFDDIIVSPKEMIQNVYTFLGVDSSDEFIPETIGEKVHAGQSMNIPSHLFKELFNIYEPQLVELADRFSGHPKKWLEGARNTLSSS